MPPKKPQPKKQQPEKAAAPLDTYQAKRNFAKTPEPAASVVVSGGHSFVIQEHRARSHHFDFRLEMDGVLVSWAVPKGIPEDSKAKRLAVHVEDHPLEYGGFEGEIPTGNYGAGTVAIWDRGTWHPLDVDWRKSFTKGKMKFELRGTRLRGVFLLARMGEEPNWLLRKIDEEPLSQVQVQPTAGKPEFVLPQLAHLVPTVPTVDQWLHELKFDGYRLVAVQHAKSLTLFTRSGNDWTDRFSVLAGRLADLTAKDFVLDGEAVVFDEKGRSRFGDLQAALQNADGELISYVAFDLLHFDGLDLRNLPLIERQKRLVKLIPDETGDIRRSTVWPAEMGSELFKQACKNGLEGIVSKPARGTYREGSRKEWTKSKCRARQEFVICGYTAPKGSPAGFGALLVASYENGKLVPRGKVGTGFSEKQRRSLVAQFVPLLTEKPPIASKERDVTWLRPELVAEIEFAEITRDGSIRHGSFVALREDKSAADVHFDGLQKSVSGTKGAVVAGIAISHPERLVFPGAQISKLEVAQYYERVGEWMMPFVARRPLAVLRAPDGISGETFFQKSFPNHLPQHVEQQELADGNTVISVKDIRGLVALAQFGVIEFHPWGAKLPAADKPDFVTWDLDPDPAVEWPEVLGAAFLLRDFLGERGLQTMVKTSGGKGLHIMLPLRRTLGWDEAREFTKRVSEEIAAYNPKRFITTATKAKRTGKIFIDWMRNGRGSTCVAPWGLRARRGAPVSLPLRWDDLPELPATGFHINDPPNPPDEWLKPQPQTVPRQFLRDLGIG